MLMNLITIIYSTCVIVGLITFGIMILMGLMLGISILIETIFPDKK